MELEGLRILVVGTGGIHSANECVHIQAAWIYVGTCGPGQKGEREGEGEKFTSPARSWACEWRSIRSNRAMDSNVCNPCVLGGSRVRVFEVSAHKSNFGRQADSPVFGFAAPLRYRCRSDGDSMVTAVTDVEVLTVVAAVMVVTNLKH